MKNLRKTLIVIACVIIGIRMIISPETMSMTSIRIIGGTIIIDGILQLIGIIFPLPKTD